MECQGTIPIIRFNGRSSSTYRGSPLSLDGGQRLRRKGEALLFFKCEHAVSALYFVGNYDESSVQTQKKNQASLVLVSEQHLCSSSSNTFCSSSSNTLCLSSADSCHRAISPLTIFLNSVSSLRLIKPDMTPQQAIEVALRFERKAFDESQDKVCFPKRIFSTQ